MGRKRKTAVEENITLENALEIAVTENTEEVTEEIAETIAETVNTEDAELKML